MKPNVLMFIAALCVSTTLFAADQPPLKKRFDFAAAEKLADQQLKRPAPPVVPAVAPVKPAATLCANCKGTLLVPCPQHKIQAAWIGENQRAAEQCKTCNGAGFIVCPTCKTKKDLADQVKEAEQKAKTAIESAQAAIKALHDVEAEGGLKYKLQCYASQHFCIGSTIDKRSILPCIHHGEGVISKLNASFYTPAADKNDTFDFFTPLDCQFFLINTVPEYQQYIEGVMKKADANLDVAMAVKASGQHNYRPPSHAVNCFERLARKDDILQHTVVHVLGHFAINRIAGARSYPAWLEEGFAAHAETMELAQPQVYCFQYTENKLDIMKNRDAALRKLASTKPIEMSRLTRMTYMDMKGDEYFQAWSMVTMLVERDADKFQNFLKALPSGEQDPGGLRIDAEEQEKALQEAYGYDYPKLIAVWRQWVLAR